MASSDLGEYLRSRRSQVGLSPHERKRQHASTPRYYSCPGQALIGYHAESVAALMGGDRMTVPIKQGE